MTISAIKFFKDNKIVRVLMASAVCSLRNIYKCLLHHIAREIMLSLVNMYMKNFTESQDKRNFERLYIALVLHENAPVFSQLEARNFFRIHH